MGGCEKRGNITYVIGAEIMKGISKLVYSRGRSLPGVEKGA